MQQHQLNQHHTHQQQHHPHMQLLSPNTSISKTNLYIRGLSESTKDQDLHDMCKMYGPIKSTKAIIDKQTLKCKGYGFVDFINQEDAQFALKKLKELDKDVQLAKQREQDPTNLYFANLPHSIDEASLTDMLQTRFNVQVSSTRIMRERTGQSKGVGFARIDESLICDRIIQELNQKPYPGLEGSNNKVLLVKLADTGNQKRQRNLTSSSSSSIINATNIPPLPPHHPHQQTTTPTAVSTTTPYAPIPVTSFNGFSVYNSFNDGTQTPLSATPTAPALLNSYLSFRNPAAAAAQVQYVPNGAQTTPYYLVQHQQQQSTNTKNGTTPTPTSSNADQQYAQIQQQFANMSLMNAPPQYYQQQSTEVNSNLIF
jgi:RNA recognition motif-containing protein